jgi:hypothetical protein
MSMTLSTLHMCTAILLMYMLFSVGHYVYCDFVDLHDVIHLRNEFIFLFVDGVSIGKKMTGNCMHQCV